MSQQHTKHSSICLAWKISGNCAISLIRVTKLDPLIMWNFLLIQLTECVSCLKRSRNIKQGQHGVYVDADGVTDSTGKLLMSAKACILIGEFSLVAKLRLQWKTVTETERINFLCIWEAKSMIIHLRSFNFQSFYIYDIRVTLRNHKLLKYKL